MVALRQSTGSFTHGLLLIAALVLIAMVIVLALGHNEALEKAPAALKES
jgi:MFS transporter, ACS family, tartrate transporter